MLSIHSSHSLRELSPPASDRVVCALLHPPCFARSHPRHHMQSVMPSWPSHRRRTGRQTLLTPPPRHPSRAPCANAPPVCHEECFGELGKVVFDVHQRERNSVRLAEIRSIYMLYVENSRPSAASRQRDGEAFVVLPVGYARRYRPLLLLLGGSLPRKTPQNGGWRTRRTTRCLVA
jgi:hypothetical protein